MLIISWYVFYVLFSSEVVVFFRYMEEDQIEGSGEGKEDVYGVGNSLGYKKGILSVKFVNLKVI